MSRREDEARREKYIPCQSCHLLDFYVVHTEATGQTAVVCQMCKVPFVQIQWVPQELPDPAVII